MKRWFVFFWIGLLSSCPLLSIASTMPVIDVTAIAQLVKQLDELRRQYAVLQDTYQTTQQQLNQTKQLTQNLEGQYGFGALFNTPDDLRRLQWSAQRWEQALQGLAGHHPERYQQLRSLFQQQHPVLSEHEFYRGQAPEPYRRYQQTQAVNETAHVHAAYVFENIDVRLQRIHDLSQRIEHTHNVKASQDLNTRLIAETAYIQLELLKLQAVQNQQWVQQSTNQQYATTVDADFIQLTRRQQ